MSPGPAVEQDCKLADDLADRGTVRHLMLRLGYFPRDEEEAEGLVVRLVAENARLGGETARGGRGARP
jgi:hypothetical protein